MYIDMYIFYKIYVLKLYIKKYVIFIIIKFCITCLGFFFYFLYVFQIFKIPLLGGYYKCRVIQKKLLYFVFNNTFN